MLSKAQKSRATVKEQRTACGPIAKGKARDGAGNRYRANELGVPRFLQRKLVIGAANDQFEQEADRVAGEVMRSPKTNAGNLKDAAKRDQTVQRTCACGGGCNKCKKKQLSLKRRSANSHEAVETPASVDGVLHSPGQPLDTTTRAFMEPRFGYDFGGVRLHTDSAAARSARDVNALAFTVGSHIAFGAGQYVPGSAQSNRLLAHELAHVVQQGGAESGPQVSNVIQRAGDPAAIPVGFQCDTDLTAGRPAGTDLPFPTGNSDVTVLHEPALTAFVAAWVAAGGTEDILVHGYASPPGTQASNWTLSCERAQHVRDALIARGIPSIHIDIVAHGESTDFGASNSDNEHAVISTSAAGLFSNPFIITSLTPRDNFAGRSNSRFGVGEVIDLDFFSVPIRAAAEFGGLRWAIASGTGALTAVTDVGTATYTAPAAADAVTLELRIASGATAGAVAGRRAIRIVEPSGVRMVRIGTGVPSFSPGGPIAAGTWGAGFTANVFADPRDVSFRGVEFGEGTVASVITGTFLTVFAATHGVNSFGLAGGGNSVTGTTISPPPDGIFSGGRGPVSIVAGVPICGVSDFLWAIPWDFRVPGGARTRIRGFTANHHATSNLTCQARIEKGGAGPFCRRINGTAC